MKVKCKAYMTLSLINCFYHRKDVKLFGGLVSFYQTYIRSCFVNKSM